MVTNAVKTLSMSIVIIYVLLLLHVHCYFLFFQLEGKNFSHEMSKYLFWPYYKDLATDKKTDRVALATLRYCCLLMELEILNILLFCTPFVFCISP